MDQDVAERWRALVAPFGAEHADVARAVETIAARYAEPHRHYHTLEHIGGVLITIDALADLADDIDAVRFAGFLHDVIYDPTRSDNEAASAAFARDLLDRLAVPTPIVRETARLIELTRGHDVDFSDRNGATLMDADLAILGTDGDRYRRYARDVRLEYGFVPDDAFRLGRARVLEGFVLRPRLFATERMHADLDARARANIRSELVELGAGDR